MSTPANDWDPTPSPADTPGDLGFFAELGLFLREEWSWWVTPAVLFVALLVTVLATSRGESGGIPFVYALF